MYYVKFNIIFKINYSSLTFNITDDLSYLLLKVKETKYLIILIEKIVFLIKQCYYLNVVTSTIKELILVQK